MPKSKVLPYEWYNTPNIHLSTVNDFRRLCETAGYQITKQINIVKRKRGQFLPNILPNSFAELAVFVLEVKS
jgi:methionine biosynthesis protein MetW